MKEREIKIKIPGTKFRIYGKLYGSLRRPTIIFVHGLTGHMDEHLFYNGARWFDEKGFSSFRFNLYDWPKDARDMDQCTLKTHAYDLDTVAKYLRRKGAREIFPVGHSYGGPTIMLSKDKDFDAAAIWDGSVGIDPFNDKDKDFRAKYVKELDAYLVNWEYGIIIGRKMREEARDIDWKALVQNVAMPTMVITAGRGHTRVWKRYQKYFQVPNKLMMLKRATHPFREEGVLEQLYEQTLNWLQKYL